MTQLNRAEQQRAEEQGQRLVLQAQQRLREEAEKGNFVDEIQFGWFVVSVKGNVKLSKVHPWFIKLKCGHVTENAYLKEWIGPVGVNLPVAPYALPWQSDTWRVTCFKDSRWSEFTVTFEKSKDVVKAEERAKQQQQENIRILRETLEKTKADAAQRATELGLTQERIDQLLNDTDVVRAMMVEFLYNKVTRRK